MSSRRHREHRNLSSAGLDDVQEKFETSVNSPRRSTFPTVSFSLSHRRAASGSHGWTFPRWANSFSLQSWKYRKTLSDSFRLKTRKVSGYETVNGKHLLRFELTSENLHQRVKNTIKRLRFSIVAFNSLMLTIVFLTLHVRRVMWRVGYLKLDVNAKDRKCQLVLYATVGCVTQLYNTSRNFTIVHATLR